MKRILAVALSMTLFAGVLAGCGTPKQAAPAETAKPAPTQEAKKEEPKKEEPKKEVKLTYMTWDYADRTKSTDAWVKDVKAKFNVAVDMQSITPDQYENLFKTRLASNDLPDLAKVHGIDRTGYLYKVKINPDLFLDLSGLSSVSEYVPSIMADTKRNGKLYYVPVSTSVLGAVYNKKVFKDLGIALPKNYAEFIAACDKIKAAGTAPIAGSFKEAWTTQIIPFIAFGQYVELKDKDSRQKLNEGTKKYSDIKAETKKALDLTLQWIDKGYISQNYLATDAPVASAMVAQGKAAMLINGTWMFKQVQDADPKAEIGFMAIPLNEANEKMLVCTSSGEGITIPSSGKNIEAAKQVLNFYLSAENQARVMDDIKGIPVNTKVQVSDPFTKEAQAVMAAGEVMPTWWGGEYLPAGNNFAFDKEIQALIAKATTSDQFIDKLVKECERALQAQKK